MKPRHSEKVSSLAEKGNEGKPWDTLHTCCLCRKTLATRGVLKDHLENVHFRSKKIFCDLCPKFYFTKSSISLHMTMHLKKKFACNVCDYKTARKGDLQQHQMVHAKKVECPVCKKSRFNLKAHMLVHKPKVSCSICQAMVLRGSLKKHLTTHETKIRKCKICEDSFDSIEELRRWVMF